MPATKTKLKNAAIAAKMAALPSIPKELIDQFVSGTMTGEAVNEATAAFKKALIERALGAECNVAISPAKATPDNQGTG
ncbi:MAG: transposase mutator type [Chitinophagaceae bacterium]|nr:transposase mutator type [Chitinophagaceae bacterium]